MDVEQDIRIYPEFDYLMNEKKCDFVFVIDGQRVPALKQVLSLKIRVFRAMLSGHWKESNDNQITIRDATFENFKSMIEFSTLDIWYSLLMIVKSISFEI